MHRTFYKIQPGPWSHKQKLFGGFDAFVEGEDEVVGEFGEKEVNVANKLSRGKFSAAFMLQCLSALKTDTLHL